MDKIPGPDGHWVHPAWFLFAVLRPKSVLVGVYRLVSDDDESSEAGYETPKFEFVTSLIAEGLREQYFLSIVPGYSDDEMAATARYG
jgi:hypothetical protein